MNLLNQVSCYWTHKNEPHKNKSMTEKKPWGNGYISGCTASLISRPALLLVLHHVVTLGPYHAASAPVALRWTERQPHYCCGPFEKQEPMFRSWITSCCLPLVLFCWGGECHSSRAVRPSVPAAGRIERPRPLSFLLASHSPWVWRKTGLMARKTNIFRNIAHCLAKVIIFITEKITV